MYMYKYTINTLQNVVQWSLYDCILLLKDVLIFIFTYKKPLKRLRIGQKDGGQVSIKPNLYLLYHSPHKHKPNQLTESIHI